LAMFKAFFKNRLFLNFLKSTLNKNSLLGVKSLVDL